ncbi:MAG: FG-GAP-like repeat-containing protein [Acidobacteriia bacterium]|nr:FG-GAP-like repeat-containing protein [Terriglobia bacterium]
MRSARLPIIALGVFTHLSLADVRAAAAQAISFAPHRDFAYTLEPGFALADLNGDGLPDLVVPDWFFAGVDVRLGSADATLQPAVKVLTTVVPPSIVAVGDVNGDGRPDIVAMDSWNQYNPTTTGKLYVLLGRGDGTFQTASPSASGGQAFAGPTSVVIRDVNRDGAPDLIVADDGAVNVLLGRGDGTFSPPARFPAGTGTVAVAVGDLDGDGAPDIVTANFDDATRHLSVLMNNGDGTFQSPQSYQIDSGMASVALVDFNNDGALDIVAASQGHPALWLLPGNGNGTFQPPSRLDLPAPDIPRAIVVGDLNGNGRADLAVTGDAVLVSVFDGNGDGTFQPRQDIVTVHGYLDTIVFGLAIADVNHDGAPDLAVLNRDSSSAGAWTVLLNTSRGRAPGGSNADWTDRRNVTASGATLAKSGGCDGCPDSGAASAQQVPSPPGEAYAEAQFSVRDAAPLFTAGLAHAFTGDEPSTIDYGVRVQSGMAEVREGGIYRAETSATAGDVFRVVLQTFPVGYQNGQPTIYWTQVIYTKNGNPFYHHLETKPLTTYPLSFAAAFLNATAAIGDATMIGGADPGGEDPPAVMRHEETDPAVTDSGSWYSSGGSWNSGDGAVLAMDAGATAMFSFTGTSVKWIGFRDQWSGLARVSIDGAPAITIDTYSAGAQAQAVIFDSGPLANGAHTITIEVAGDHDPASACDWVWIDAFDVSSF